MTAESVPRDDLLTIDELASVSGTTVRTTRYYAQLGLIPPPERRGRVAYYGDVHRARLDVVRRLQEHGFTLQAIERYMADLPDEATPEDLALRRAMLTSWTPTPTRRLSRQEVEAEAGRRLADDELALLETLYGLERQGDGWVPTPGFGVAVQLLDVDIPEGAMREAGAAISRHMDELAQELTQIMQEQILEPFRRQALTPEDAARFEGTVSRLRRLTLEAVVAGFQRAADAVIRRSLVR